MELQGGYFRVFWGYFKLFWRYFGPLGAHQTTLSYSLLNLKSVIMSYLAPPWALLDQGPLGPPWLLPGLFLALPGSSLGPPWLLPGPSL